MVTTDPPKNGGELLQVPELIKPQGNIARPGLLPLADRIGEPDHVIVGGPIERPGPPPQYLGPPPVAAEPAGLAPVPDKSVRP
ncbi:hypothetical protein [Nocardia colli]|uniref:hypothetical protein n=1 Tax=Nocardia colli TaxID=2545717 RepID=UPI001CC7AA59|nr:hypothetical protein [Nocardia colli]